MAEPINFYLPKQQQRTKNFTLEITTSALCNLDCTYCFEGKKTNKQRLDDKVDILKQRIYELHDSDFIQNNYDVLNISFWGGEPTLNEDLIITLMQEFQHFDDIEFHTYTNGYQRKRLDKIINNVDISKLNVQISYDGKTTNDLFRLTSSGKPTSVAVMENLDYLAEKGVNVSLKATIPIKSIEHIMDAWYDYKRIFERLQKYDNDRIYVSYSPTVDYYDKYSEEEVRQILDDFRVQILKMASEEIKFFNEHGRHLCSWFAGGETKIHCASGASMHAIDVDGKSYACHGSLYSDNKQLMQGSDIMEDDFVEKVQLMSEQYSQHIKTVPKVCEDCVATTCMVCPVTSLDNSKNEEYFDKWTDRWADNMCGFYKTFGEIDRTVQSVLIKNGNMQP
jgi:sulfatase maturation enzyme AslB (radical SAM superfamily)